MSEQVNNSSLAEAIFNIQQECPAIKKTSDGQVGTRAYKYANLNDVWDTVKGLMRKNKVLATSNPTGTSDTGMTGNFFKMTLIHVPTGEKITETMPMLLQREDPQALGAAITYYRRYMLCSMLGIITDDDNDAREQRLATYEQKKQVMGAVHVTFPEVEDPAKINQLLSEILGKHPSTLREEEVDNAIKLIQSYKKD